MSHNSDSHSYVYTIAIIELNEIDCTRRKTGLTSRLHAVLLTKSVKRSLVGACVLEKCCKFSWRGLNWVRLALCNFPQRSGTSCYKITFINLQGQQPIMHLRITSVGIRIPFLICFFRSFWTSFFNLFSVLYLFLFNCSFICSHVICMSP
jgi:hypothetical protein